MISKNEITVSKIDYYTWKIAALLLFLLFLYEMYVIRFLCLLRPW